MHLVHRLHTKTTDEWTVPPKRCLMWRSLPLATYGGGHLGGSVSKTQVASRVVLVEKSDLMGYEGVDNP